MAEKKQILLRLEKEIYDGLRRWADDDIRSVNAQIEYLLRETLRREGRLPNRPSRSKRADD